MKNIEAGVDVIHIQEKKEEVEEEKNKVVTNIVRFYLKDDPRLKFRRWVCGVKIPEVKRLGM